MGGQEPAELEDHLVLVEHAEAEHEGVVAVVDLAELDLAQRLLPGDAARRTPLGGPGAVAQVARPDPLGLEDVDPLEQPGEQPGGVAADLMAAQRQLVEVVEEQGEAVRRRGRLEERVDAGLERVVAEHPLGEARPGLHPELLEGAREQRGDPLPQDRLVGGALGDHGDPLDGDPLVGERCDPAGDQLGPPRPRGAEHQRGPLTVRERPLEAVHALLGIAHRPNRSEGRQ